MGDTEGYDEENPYRAPEAQEEFVHPRGMGTVGIDLATESPFLTIWTRPRATIRAIIDAGPGRRVVPVILAAALVVGLYDGLMQANGPRQTHGAALAIALAVGPPKWLAILYLGGWFLTITGRWLGGKANSRQVRLALAWSCIPIPPVLATALVETALGGLGHMPAVIRSEDVPLVLGAVGARVVQSVFLTWWLVIMVKGLAEAHRFSALRAIGSLLVIYLIAVICFLVAYLASLGIPSLRGFFA